MERGWNKFLQPSECGGLMDGIHKTQKYFFTLYIFGGCVSY